MELHVLRFLLAAVVMVLAQLVPAPASAHGGHDHRSPVAHHVTAQTALDQAASDDATALSSPSRASVGIAVMTASHGGACAPDCFACAGGGTACCCGAAMILPGALGLPGRASLPVAVVSRNVATPLGIGPEALPEPPRPNA